MADTERISQPSQGSNELGTETNDTHLGNRGSSGTDTQLHLAAKSGKKHNNNTDINDDEKVVKNNTDNGLLKSNETDE